MSYIIEIQGGSIKIPDMRKTVHIGKMGELDINVDNKRDISLKGKEYSDVLYAVSNVTRQLDEKLDEKPADPLSILTWKINILAGVLSDAELPVKYKDKKLPPEYGTVTKLVSFGKSGQAGKEILSYKKPGEAEESAQPETEEEGPVEVMMSAIIQYCSSHGPLSFGKSIMQGKLTDREIMFKPDKGGCAVIQYKDDKEMKNIAKDIEAINKELENGQRTKGFSIVLREGCKGVDEAEEKFLKYRPIGETQSRSEN